MRKGTPEKPVATVRKPSRTAAIFESLLRLLRFSEVPRQRAICIVGLGYVGLPLAHAFARAGMEVFGYDVSEERIEELRNGMDRTNELTERELKSVTITFTTDPTVIGKADVVILAIPTPVDGQNRPDLTLLEEATKTVGRHFKDGAIIVYESTVYPGVTEEICGPILQKESGGKSFRLGYSPERINPGDREHTIDKVVKVVAGEDKVTTDALAELYGTIAPIHRAPCITVAEMAKAIENAQRDLNIAYMNEVAKLCHRLGIATKDVLDAASTKWNFLRFSPGLVGGHCIGVDPYYLLEKARALNIGMDIVTAARSTNDGMAAYVAWQVLEALNASVGAPRPAPHRSERSEDLVLGCGAQGNIQQQKPHVLVLGLTFKENIPDTRNSKSGEAVALLEQSGCMVHTHDPHVESNEALEQRGAYDAILLLVPHRKYLAMTPGDFAKLGKEGCLFYDLKSVFFREAIEETGMTYLAL